MFDISAIAYTNLLYFALLAGPLHYKENSTIESIQKWFFVIVNAFCLLINLVDCVYFFYSQHRTTASFFKEFQNDNNLGGIFAVEFLSHWYLVLVFITIVYCLVKYYAKCPQPVMATPVKLIDKIRYYTCQVCFFLVVVFVAILSIRGWTMTKASRPISVNDAQLFVDNASYSGAVLNTPFAIIRTLDSKDIVTPKYFDTEEELRQLYSPVHYPAGSLRIRKKNVVIFLVEGLSREFQGTINKHLDNGSYKGYTPFLDSLMQHSLYSERSFSNSGFSIDAPPSVLASIPRMNRPFVVTEFSLNHLSSLASELKNWGYTSAFFHGAENGSLNIESFTHSIGVDLYFGRNEYNKDPHFSGDSDFDGTWGIWDEEFLQFYAQTMSSLSTPFVTSLFTLSSHHPYSLPDKYKDIFKDEGSMPVFKCVRYTDNALRLFFETAKTQPWYENTLFVITADHSSPRFAHEEFGNELGRFRVPVIFFDPSGEMPRGEYPGIIQQIDIMPSILSWLGYDRPYVAFGTDIFTTAPEDTWAINWDHLPQYIWGDYLLQHNVMQPIGLYNYRKDPLLKDNLLSEMPDTAKFMQQHLEAFIQTFVERMRVDDVVYKDKN